MSLRLVESQTIEEQGLDPRDPALYRSVLSSARAALREGRARQHARATHDIAPDDGHEGTEGGDLDA